MKVNVNERPRRWLQLGLRKGCPSPVGWAEEANRANRFQICVEKTRVSFEMTAIVDHLQLFGRGDVGHRAARD